MPPPAQLLAKLTAWAPRVRRPSPPGGGPMQRRPPHPTALPIPCPAIPTAEAAERPNRAALPDPRGAPRAARWSAPGVPAGCLAHSTRSRRVLRLRRHIAWRSCLTSEEAHRPRLPRRLAPAALRPRRPNPSCTRLDPVRGPGAISPRRIRWPSEHCPATKPVRPKACGLGAAEAVVSDSGASARRLVSLQRDCPPLAGRRSDRRKSPPPAPAPSPEAPPPRIPDRRPDGSTRRRLHHCAKPVCPGYPSQSGKVSIKSKASTLLRASNMVERLAPARNRQIK